MTSWIDVAAASDVAEDCAFAVSVGDRDLALFRFGDEVFALIDKCSHGAARLSEGYVENGCVECPLHQGLVDIRSGEPRSQPIVEAVQCFPARLRDGRIEVEL